jgi:catechol 2,3-dioxygenase-like lactoylglutathione lyase family enzyme
MIVQSVDHVCFSVSDLERSIGFWRHLLGTEPESRVEYTAPYDQAVTGYSPLHMSAVYFRLPGGPLLELFQYHEPPAAPAPSSETYVVGNAHLGLVVDDLDEAYRHLQATGATFRSDGPVLIEGGAHAGARSMYVRDPDGITIEILELPH